MEDGQEIVRRRRLSIWTEIQVDYVMTLAQYDTLKDFWRTDLNAGASPFTMPIWDFSGSLVSKSVLWQGGGPVPEPIGTKVRVSFSVKVRDFYA